MITQVVILNRLAKTARKEDGLAEQGRAFIACSDAISEILAVQRRPQDAGEAECSASELRMLAALGRQEPVAMSHLAAALRMPLSTATRVADKLVKKGLVERRRADADRRVVEIGFSTRGREINRFVARRRLATARKLLGGLSAADRARLIELTGMMLL